MRFRKIVILLTILTLSITISSFPVLAHPGKTDGNGGHADHDSGDYHYHHGYPAHDHYDMNSDGIVDCPYDFDDKTDHSSSNRENPVDQVYDHSNDDGDVNIRSPKPEEKKDWVSDLLGFIMIGVYLFIFFILPVIGSRK